ncbi:hypothetical protein KAFR_0A03720 [Kazachstania africana CBS 2517]|uniref:GrpE protein homolog n=1 Tax=Kazachstania africana (strain ATCC 22294 / BCRC 22015 / CBS 2517 / CECT 1963 / NBRC 1671 / NRRL Y-8276) TaxID=1071382 RepID=H2AN57_KAZAF|nr:hypothetical protein KAFR_0A03720 [Kazachstania africana CBS 2517]CCF55807.1 hypothetical protein KAFR_0A03720 [Kazachstania africana CBS 2517]
MRAVSSTFLRTFQRGVFIPYAARSAPASATMVMRSNLISLPTGRFYSDSSKQEPKIEKKEEEVSNESALKEEQQNLKELQAKLDSKTKEAIELKDRLLRSVADFRNLQEVTKKDVEKAKNFALQKFAKDLLESVDNFGHALGAFKEDDLKKSKEIADLYTGVRMTRDVFESTLKKHGIQKVDPLGEVFDPNLHEATFQAPQKDKEPGTIFHVQQLGYTLNDRVIRPAKVGIVKGEDGN